MKRYSLVSAIGITIFSSLSACHFAAAQWRHDQRPGQPQQGPPQQGQPQQAQQHAQEAQQQAQQAQQHAAQEQMQRGQQQSQQRQQQAQQAQQQAAQQRQQQAQQRNTQEQAQREQQRQQQAQQRDQQSQQHAQEQLQRTQQSQQQTQQAQQQAAQERQQQAQQRNAQERAQIDQQRQQSAQQRDAQAQTQKEQHRQQNSWNQNGSHQMPQPGQGGVERIQNPIQLSKFDKKNSRLSTVPPLKVQPIPLQKAFPMPNFAEHASDDQLNQARIAQNNMIKHLRAVPISQAPRNYGFFRTRQLQSYYNNYPFNVNNHPYFINRQNTNYYQVPPNNYPSWYQQNPNWVYSNGFTLANAIRVGPDWLGYGWQPYYGAPPTGFICARDYIPTPWLYEAATGQWRQPGLYSYVSEGPGYDYTGPITVEVIEQIVAPNGQVVNVPYLYNAFYYPEQGRWAYENRQGYFIWVEV